MRTAAAGLLVYSRIDRAAKREYVAAFNAGAAAVHVSVATATPSVSWAALLGAPGPVSSDASGTLAFDVPGLSVVLLRANGDIPAAAPTAPALKVAADSLSDYWFASVPAPARPVSVAFAVRRAGAKAWQRLAVDDSPPYRALINPKAYKRREQIYVVAIVHALDGSTAVSRVVTATPRR